MAPTATANKGYVFSCWDRGGLLHPAGYVFEMPEADPNLEAVFVTLAEELDNVRTGLLTAEDAEPVQLAENQPIDLAVTCGVAVDWSLAAEGLTENSIAVSGLPTGLKFTAKDVVDTKTKQVMVPANTIYGVPTAASKLDKNGVPTPSVVKITVTTAGKQKLEYRLNVVVEALPAWATGTFNGFMMDQQLSGAATLTIDAKGKVSGKISEADGRVWTLAAANFDHALGDDSYEINNLVATYKDAKAKPAVTYVRNFDVLVTRMECDDGSFIGIVDGGWEPEDGGGARRSPRGAGLLEDPVRRSRQ